MATQNSNSGQSDSQMWDPMDFSCPAPSIQLNPDGLLGNGCLL